MHDDESSCLATEPLERHQGVSEVGVARCAGGISVESRSRTKTSRSTRRICAACRNNDRAGSGASRGSIAIWAKRSARNSSNVAFPRASSRKRLQMTQQIQDAMKQRIEQLDWMSPETKQQALAKLAKMRNKIGYPEKWRDYSALNVDPDDFYGNVARATDFEIKRQAAKVGKPVDRNEWAMTPVTVNAYYDAAKNDMNFPAAVLLPPLFDPKIDDAPNYGNTGGTIGHELTHGFDDEGRQYDGDGNLKDWWQKKDAEEFERARNACASNTRSTRSSTTSRSIAR